MTQQADIRTLASAARKAGRDLAALSGAQRTAALKAIATGLRNQQDRILAANELDLQRGRERDLAPAFLDRLTLTPARIEAMARAVDEIAAQNDPIGAVDSEIVRPNGLRVARERIPLGVVAVIYEARPNVTSDAAAIALRSGNAILLKGGSDAQRSNEAVGLVLQDALRETGLPPACVQVVTATDRQQIADMLQLDDLIDVVIPRGGEGLIRFVADNSRIPVIKHYKGVCHVYVDRHADLTMALDIALNAKVQRPGVCNAMETLLVHRDAAADFLPALRDAMTSRHVTLHACDRTRQLLDDPRVVPATDDDWHAEYLSLDLAVRVVDDLDQAVAHIEAYGSDHTEAIVTRDIGTAQEFRRRIQSSCVMINASTRFADGGELGLGAEIGISTSRLHAYGPMGVEGLTTTRFVVTGSGQVRS